MSVGAGMTTVGRTSDNGISFPDDSNVSRYHAEIESREDEYWIKDLDSSNGTTVNGARVNGDMLLKDGDEIMLGGSSAITIEVIKEGSQAGGYSATGSGAGADGEDAETSEDGEGEEEAYEEAEDEPKSNSTRNALIAAGAGICLIGVLAIGGIAFYATRGPSCPATVTISGVDKGETIVGEKDIDIEIENEPNEGCVGGAVLYVDGKAVYKEKGSATSFKLNSNDIPEFADGLSHYLTVVLIDEEDGVISSSEPIFVAFETHKVAKPEDEPDKGDIAKGGDPDNGGKTGSSDGAKQLSLIEVNTMAKQLLTKFSGKRSYDLSNQQFLQEVRKKTADYASDGYFERAQKYRDQINVEFVHENNLDASFGFILAMSRSKFVPAKQGTGEGLWQMDPQFAKENAYVGLCGTETIGDPQQKCAARAAAMYMKAIVWNVFEGDMIYGAAAFGKSPADAAAWRSTLPPNRADVWGSIRTPLERENLINFFAAGIVTENPQKFGLKDKPLSDLYRLKL
jgi:hypothetical protein